MGVAARHHRTSVLTTRPGITHKGRAGRPDEQVERARDCLGSCVACARWKWRGSSARSGGRCPSGRPRVCTRARAQPVLRRGGRRILLDDGARSGPVPPSVREAIGARLARLAAATARRHGGGDRWPRVWCRISARATLTDRGWAYEQVGRHDAADARTAFDAGRGLVGGALELRDWRLGRFTRAWWSYGGRRAAQESTYSRSGMWALPDSECERSAVQ
jgi:hypothetical protein